jgi:hypothetical protein
MLFHLEAFADSIKDGRPNAVYILAEDLGWGDVGLLREGYGNRSSLLLLR